jgi:hypothetical protein
MHTDTDCFLQLLQVAGLVRFLSGAAGASGVWQQRRTPDRWLCSGRNVSVENSWKQQGRCVSQRVTRASGIALRHVRITNTRRVDLRYHRPRGGDTRHHHLPSLGWVMLVACDILAPSPTRIARPTRSLSDMRRCVPRSFTSMIGRGRGEGPGNIV